MLLLVAPFRIKWNLERILRSSFFKVANSIISANCEVSRRIHYRIWLLFNNQNNASCFLAWNLLSTTVMVQNNDVDTAFHLLNRLMEREGLMKIIRNTVRYQKPYMQRNQLSMEASNAILEEDRDRKFKFLVRKHRADAYPDAHATDPYNA
uniref:Ribosomal protein S21 n=1 Tax=Globodera rostochiensis TaxID=31243 RepID=A0A914H7P6_GLORO